MKSGRWLWVIVGGLFLLMAGAWAAMFFFAGQAHVESVPLAAPANPGSGEAR